MLNAAGIHGGIGAVTQLERVAQVLHASEGGAEAMCGREVVAPPMSDRCKVAVMHGHEAALSTCGHGKVAVTYGHEEVLSMGGHKAVAPLMGGHSKVAAAYGHEVALPKYGHGDAVAALTAAAAAFVRGTRLSDLVDGEGSVDLFHGGGTLWCLRIER